MPGTDKENLLPALQSIGDFIISPWF